MAGDNKLIRIANGMGFWGDWQEAPHRMMEEGPIDYLVLDYLAEVTMSIMQKQKQRNPELGFATDVVDLAVDLLPRLLSDGIRIVTNAGGVNPLACAKQILKRAEQEGIRGVRVAVVHGDDIFPQIDDMLARGVRFDESSSGRGIEEIRDNLLSANVYLGAAPLVEALQQDAQIVIAGRTTDTALTLAPVMYEFQWQEQDWDRLAAGTIAGHIIECGAQCTGGNCCFDWMSIPDMDRIGYPIIEASEDGTFLVTKHSGSGGRVSMATVKEQLLYELGDPQNYLTPDCRADFSSIELHQECEDCVAVVGARGGPRPETLKTSLTYKDGYKATGTLVYSWPQAIEKARAAERIVRKRLSALGLQFDEIHVALLGIDACHGPVAIPNPNPQEVQLRMGVRSSERAAVERFSREMIPLVLNGPPTATGFSEGRPKVQEVVAYYSSLLPREEIVPKVELFELQ